jgi:hypothetical protein
MKTKRSTTCFIAILVALFTGNVFAQKSYVSFNAGYGAKMGSQNLEDFYNYTYSTTGDFEYEYTSTHKNEQINLSLGKGLNLGGSFGHMFNKNIGAELGISYLLGGKTEAKDTYTYNGEQYGTTKYIISAKMLRIVPTLVVTTGMEKLNPYAKFGVILGTGSVKYEYKDDEDGDIEIREMKMKGGLAMGLNTAIGVTFDFSEKMSFFGEINMVNMTYAPKKGEVTKATYNGIDELADMTTSEKEIEFVKSYTVSSAEPPSDSEASKELSRKLPFGSIGLNIGILIGL